MTVYVRDSSGGAGDSTLASTYTQGAKSANDTVTYSKYWGSYGRILKTVYGSNSLPIFHLMEGVRMFLILL